MIAILLGFTAALSLGVLGADPDLQIGPASAGSVLTLESRHRIDFPDSIVIDLSADGPSEVESVRIFYKVGQSDTTVYAYPSSFDNSSRLSARFVIDASGNDFIPQGVDIEYYYVFSDSEGRETASDRFAFEYLDPAYDWKRMKFEDFTLIWHDRPARAVRSVGGMVSVKMARVKRLLGLDGSYDFKAVLVNGRAEANRSFPPVSQTSRDVSLYGGFAFGQYGALTLAGLDPDGLTHELTHLMVDEATASRMTAIPAWLNEGIAMYFETPNQRRPATVRRALARGDLIPLRYMRAVPGRPDDVRLFYAQSASVVRFMAESFGEDRLSALFSAIADGQGFHDALAEIYGMDTDHLDAAWRASVSANRGSIFRFTDPGALGTSAIIGGALLASVSIATARWIKRMRQPDPSE